MKRIIVDDELRKTLLDFSEDIELVDEAGRILARVQRSTPWLDPDEWEPLTPEISAEEIQRRLESGEPTYSTEEVLAKLRQL